MFLKYIAFTAFSYFIVLAYVFISDCPQWGQSPLIIYIYLSPLGTALITNQNLSLLRLYLDGLAKAPWRSCNLQTYRLYNIPTVSIYLLLLCRSAPHFHPLNPSAKSL
jgi:hypothetical protein